MTESTAVLETQTDAHRAVVPYKWELLALLWFAYFFNRADKQLFNCVIPDIGADLHLTKVQLGLIATIFNWTYGLLVPFGGYLGDLLRRKWVIAISVLLWSAATMFTGFAAGMLSLLLLRALATGAGESFYYPSATSLIGQFHHRTRALAMSIHQTALYVGVIVCGAIAGWLAETYSWRHSFYVFGIGGMALGFVLVWRLRDTPHPKNNESEEKAERLPVGEIVGYLRKKPTFIFLALAFACMAFVDIGFVTWMPTYLHEKYSMTEASAGFTSMFYHHVAAFIGILLAGRFTDFLAPRRRHIRLEAQMIGLAGAVPFIWIMGATHSKIVCIIAMTVFGLFRGIWESNLYATLFEVVAPRIRSSAVSIMICFAFLTGALAPVILAAMAGHLGMGLGLANLAFVYLAGAILYFIAWLKFFTPDCTPLNAEPAAA